MLLLEIHHSTNGASLSVHGPQRTTGGQKWTGIGWERRPSLVSLVLVLEASFGDSRTLQDVCYSHWFYFGQVKSIWSSDSSLQFTFDVYAHTWPFLSASSLPNQITRDDQGCFFKWWDASICGRTFFAPVARKIQRTKNNGRTFMYGRKLNG